MRKIKGRVVCWLNTQEEQAGMARAALDRLGEAVVNMATDLRRIADALEPHAVVEVRVVGRKKGVLWDKVGGETGDVVSVPPEGSDPEVITTALRSLRFGEAWDCVIRPQQDIAIDHIEVVAHGPYEVTVNHVYLGDRVAFTSFGGTVTPFVGARNTTIAAGLDIQLQINLLSFLSKSLGELRLNL